MIVYAMILFLTAALFGIVAAQIYKGNINLIHDYHQTRVTDKTGYGKAFGKAMGLIAAAMALSGVIALFGEAVMGFAVVVLMIGLAAGIAMIVRVQKKYNGGMF